MAPFPPNAIPRLRDLCSCGFFYCIIIALYLLHYIHYNIMDQRFLPPSHALPHAHPHALNVHSQLTLRVHSQTSHILFINPLQNHKILLTFYGYTNLCKELMLIKLFFIILGRRDEILPASSFLFNFLDSFYYPGI